MYQIVDLKIHSYYFIVLHFIDDNIFVKLYWYPDYWLSKWEN